MIPACIILTLLIGGLLAWMAGHDNPLHAKIISLGALAISAFLWVVLLIKNFSGLRQGAFVSEFSVPWIPQIGVSVHLAADGLSLAFIALTIVLGIVSVFGSWNEVTKRVGFFHFNLLWVLAGVAGVFMSFDMFLFYFFWEMMLIPMYFLIAIWGHEKKTYASIKFFIFTQASGLFMLLSILALFYFHGRATGNFTFDYFALLQDRAAMSMGARTAMLVMLGFFAAFAVKLPAFPFHSWLPDAHTEAPTAGSIVLAGLLLKTGGYGLIRFVLPLFPEASARFAPVAITLGVIGVLYGAVLAFSQQDMKRLIADTSISHMGFVLIGIFALNQTALTGAFIEMLAHGVSTGMLFFIAGTLADRVGTRDMARISVAAERPLWSATPRIGSIGIIFALASMGLPGMGNFVGEFLVLFGAFVAHPAVAIIASLGMVAATAYSLRLIRKTFFGGKGRERVSAPVLPGKLADFNMGEAAVSAAMIMAIVWLGIYPQPIINTVGPVLGKAIASQQSAAPVKQAQAGPGGGTGQGCHSVTKCGLHKKTLYIDGVLQGGREYGGEKGVQWAPGN